MTKILVINPVGTDLWDESDKEYLSKFLSKGFQLDVRSLKYGPHSLESSFDVVLASPFIVEEVKKAEIEGYKAIIINCFLNPGIEAAREVTSIPVVGPGEASIYLACMLGEKFSILGLGGTVGSKEYTKLVRSLGLLDRLASVRTIELPVLELDRDREKTFGLLVEAGKRAIEEDGADVLILGCTGLTGFEKELEKELGVPVIYPGLVALKFAETLVRLGISHSKKAYPKPLPKKRIHPEEV